MMRVLALHGFLGMPKDWNIPGLHNVEAPSLNRPPLLSLQKWAEHFNQEHQNADILMGYSMGGRLAMHALAQNPERWRAAIIISAHPGLKTDEERQARLERDKKWARRFREDEWKLLMQDWENQVVFNTDRYLFTRNEKDYSRCVLSRQLQEWSLGCQQSFISVLALLPIPVLYCIGERDERLKELLSDFSFSHPLSELWIAKDCGHRLLWQEPNAFKQQYLEFLSRVNGDSFHARYLTEDRMGTC